MTKVPSIGENGSVSQPSSWEFLCLLGDAWPTLVSPRAAIPMQHTDSTVASRCLFQFASAKVCKVVVVGTKINGMCTNFLFYVRRTRHMLFHVTTRQHGFHSTCRLRMHLKPLFVVTPPKACIFGCEYSSISNFGASTKCGTKRTNRGMGGTEAQHIETECTDIIVILFTSASQVPKRSNEHAKTFESTVQ